MLNSSLKLRSFFTILIFIFGATVYSQNLISSMVDTVSIHNLLNHIRLLESPGGHNSRVTLTAGNDSAVIYIKKEFEKIPGLQVELDTFFITNAVYPYNTKPQFNVVATLKGEEESAGTFILSAHYDCSASRMGSSVWNSQWKTIKAPGADDNATGVSAVIEIARILSDPSFGFRHKHTIKFIAFGAEESGPAFTGSHYGSLHFAEKADLNNNNIIGVLNIDMIGYNDNYNFQSIVSNSGSQWLGEKFIDMNNKYNLDLIINPPPFVEASYSDHASFWNYGFDAILLIENAPPWNSNSYYAANPFYHKSSDSSGTLNMELVKKVTQTSLAVTAELTSINYVPVELTKFYSVKNGNLISLIWKTASELNNYGFEIQKKWDKNDWITIGFKKGKGTTTEASDYIFEDLNPLAGKYYYRLKQIDYDGTFSYSETIQLISAPENFYLSQNYPNPFNPETKIGFSIPSWISDNIVTLTIYDLLGNEIATLINEEKPAGNYEISFNASELPSGVYFYNLSSGNFSATKRMLLLK